MLKKLQMNARQGKNDRPICREQIGTALLARRVEGRIPAIKSAVYKL